MLDERSKIAFCFVRCILFSVIIKTLRQVAELEYLILKEVLGEKKAKNKQGLLINRF